MNGHSEDCVCTVCELEMLAEARRNGHSEDCVCTVCELEMLAEARRKRDAENRKAIYLEGKITGRLEAAAQCYQIATSHEFGFEAAKTIRETFKLEI